MLIRSLPSFWVPSTLKVDLADVFTLPLNVNPSFNVISSAESGKFDCGFAQLFVSADIIIHNFDNYVVSSILHIDFKSLVPDGGQATTLFHSCLEILLASRDFNVRIHLANYIRVASQTGFFH